MARINKLYPGGFILCEEQLSEIPSSYKKIKIANKYNYYFEETVEKSILTKNNTTMIIHGHSVYIDYDEIIEGKSLINKLLEEYNNNYSDFLKTLDFIAGRYVVMIISDSKFEVYQDAVGARSVYYMLDRDVISSHIHLIFDNFETKSDYLVENIKGLDQYFDSTKFENVKSLVPNFKLNFYDKTIERFFPRQENRYNNLSDDERVSKIMYLWKEQISYYTKNYKPLLSITGGNDSRVSLALAYDFKDVINFFTYAPENSDVTSDNISMSILSRDKVIVDKILNLIDINHKYILFGKYSESQFDSLNKEAIKKNSTFNHQHMLLRYYEEYYPENNIMHIRSNLLEIGRAHNINKRRTNNYKEVLNTIRHRLKKNWNPDLNDEMDEYENLKVKLYNYDEYLYGYHLLDLFHWEHRVGRWHTEVLNGTDYSYETMLPFNLRAIIEMSLSFDLTKRKNDYLFKELINKSLPILNFPGSNNLSNIYETDVAPKLKDSIINNFTVINGDFSKQLQFESLGNQIYIPESFLSKGSKARVEFEFKQDSGTIMLELFNGYKSKIANEYLRYEILVNDNIVMYEDMSKWNLPNTVYVYNLKKTDKITVQVVCLKNLSVRSWELASKLQISNIKELSNNTEVSQNVTCTSPYSIIL
ncbi:hypothetical protein [Jeotgalicoccus meleagridis]|uniref:Asparagine synthetase domain-containing protein n=1 Tax=Jeotgalicoccus meleagridis TaxID=2759181 RepID=A0A6V7RLE6_9STAP|nr:hypothetical protein [Jeotgalicoccus meleagridis]CAD2078901.1 hypothetical protein JEODO184_01522 [Jeotgalicoccus meleagridis]